MARHIAKFKDGDEVYYLTGSSGWLRGIVMNVFPSLAYQGSDMRVVGYFYKVNDIVRLFHETELRPVSE